MAFDLTKAIALKTSMRLCVGHTDGARRCGFAAKTRGNEMGALQATLILRCTTGGYRAFLRKARSPCGIGAAEVVLAL